MPLNTRRPCHTILGQDESLLGHAFKDGQCSRCHWSTCSAGCGTYVPDVSTPCGDCRETGGIPEDLEEEKTVREQTAWDPEELRLVVVDVLTTRRAA